MSVGTDTATTCMQDLGTLLLGAAKIWAASNRLISPISHISAIFRIVFTQDQRSLTMSDQGSNSSFSYKHQTSTIVSAAHQIYRLEIRPRSPTFPNQSHPRKYIHIQRNFYQDNPLIARAVGRNVRMPRRATSVSHGLPIPERSLKFRCLRLSISLARAIFVMDGNALACNAKRHSGT